MDILITTVGSSCEPIVNAIKTRKPDFVYFVCSSGKNGSWISVEAKGKPCQERDKSPLPNIVSQAGLTSEQYKIWLIDDPDNLAHCYDRLMKLGHELKDQFGKTPNITANYTGGTKTMSVALCLMALNQENWDLELNKGPRVDLIKVKTGDVPILMNKWEIFVEHQLKLIKYFISNFNSFHWVIYTIILNPCFLYSFLNFFRSKHVLMSKFIYISFFSVLICFV